MRWLVALALGVVLASPAWAGPGRTTRTGEEAASFGRVWETAAAWLAGGWQAVVAGVTADRGAMSDPDGAAATADSDRGAMSDPDG